jgi:surfactin family lipopeptide synthetase A
VEEPSTQVRQGAGQPNPQSSEAKRRLLEKYLEGSIVEAGARARLLAPRPSGRPAPLSFSQEQLFLREKSRPNLPPLYNECITLRIIGPLDVPVLERSLAEIIRRHEIWRTSYDTRNGQTVQVVHPIGTEPRLPLVDLRGLPGSRREVETRRVIGEEVRRPFDLEAGPLLRARLVRMDEFENYLFLIAHLSILDGVSAYQIFPHELAALYRAYSSGQPSPLRELDVQFGDYADWQRRWLRGEEQLKQVAYWRKQLAGDLPVLKWPTDRPRPSEETFRGAVCPFALPKALVEGVKQLCRQEGVTLFMTLLAALATLLQSYTQQDDITIGTLSPAGRKRSEVERLLGYFLNPVALRFDLTGNPTFRELLRQTRRLTLEAISNDDVPFELLAQELRGKPDPSRNPFFTVAISLQPPSSPVGFDWSVTSMDVESGGAPWDLYLAFIDAPRGMMGRAQYNPDLFERETILGTFRDFQQVLERVSAAPLVRLSEVRS